MGLIASIYRDDYDSIANHFHGKREVTLMNVEGPFDPTNDRPAAMLIAGPQGGIEPNPIIVPARQDDAGAWVPDRPDGMVGPMFGGTYAGTSDSRFGEAVRVLLGDPDPSGLNRPPFRTSSVRSPIPVHDRFERWAEGNR